jgi:hypothetical protein
MADPGRKGNLSGLKRLFHLKSRGKPKDDPVNSAFMVINTLVEFLQLINLPLE